jgi:hypothetical protein
LTRQFEQGDLRHPLRNPGYTLLDLVSAGGGEFAAARAATAAAREIGRSTTVRGGVGGAARAVWHTRKPKVAAAAGAMRYGSRYGVAQEPRSPIVDALVKQRLAADRRHHNLR